MTLSDIYSDSLFGILSFILSDILSGRYSGILFWRMFEFGSMRAPLHPGLAFGARSAHELAVEEGGEEEKEGRTEGRKELHLC